MINLNYKILLATVPLVILLASCATPDRKQDQEIAAVDNSTPDSDTEEYVLNEEYNLSTIEYTVQQGDRLSNIALDITGDATNWREIADFNGITNPRSLQAGVLLAIPTDLIAGYEGTSNVLSTPAELSTPLEQTTVTPEAQSSSLAIRRNEVTDAQVIVTPVNINREFDLNPIDPNAPPAELSYSGDGTQVKVIGSYYPKGIYTEPAAYSKLIFRAAPGTLFVLDSKVNDWYKIELTSGNGYIRTSDATIVETSE